MRYRVALLATLAVTVAGIGLMFWSKPTAGAHVGIDAISFDATGWRRHDTSFSSMMWKRDDGELLELKWVPKFPDVDPDQDIESIRAESRRLASARGGSLLSAEVLPIAGRQASTLIYKRDRPSGPEYIGMLFVRDDDDRFVFSVVSKGGETAESRVRAFLRGLQQTLAFP